VQARIGVVGVGCRSSRRQHRSFLGLPNDKNNKEKLRMQTMRMRRNESENNENENIIIASLPLRKMGADHTPHNGTGESDK